VAFNATNQYFIQLMPSTPFDSLLTKRSTALMILKLKMMATYRVRRLVLG
jgi:hypothetical protein